MPKKQGLKEENQSISKPTPYLPVSKTEKGSKNAAPQNKKAKQPPLDFHSHNTTTTQCNW